MITKKWRLDFGDLEVTDDLNKISLHQSKLQ